MDRFIKTITKEAGAVVLKRFKNARAKYYKSKSRVDVVTSTDLLSEKMLITRIKKQYPHHGIIAEESGHWNSDAEYVWTIDPVDGTLNFASGVPIFGVMVALMRMKQIILAAVYLPVTDDLVFAKRGKGAYLNGKRIHCSKTTNRLTSRGMVSASLRNPHTTTFLKHLYKKVQGGHAITQSLGAAAANCRYIAGGECDWMAGASGQLHDYAPLSLILREAGCKVTGLDGKPWTMESSGLVAANPRLHAKLMQIVRKAWK